MTAESQGAEFGHEIHKTQEEKLRDVFADIQNELREGRHQRVLNNTHYQTKTAEISALLSDFARYNPSSPSCEKLQSSRTRREAS
jgi:hypothetical protein